MTEQTAEGGVPPEPFEYALECAYCGAVHKPTVITPQFGNKVTVWKVNCARCGRENELRFHPVKYREARQ